jgi:flagellar biosynthetic protein FliP
MTGARLCMIIIFGLGFLAFPETAFSQSDIDPSIQTSEITRTALLLTLLAVIPALFISMTSFMRIVIVLAMVRHAFGMPETPPNPVLVSLALFLSLFIMAPTLSEANVQAVQPFMQGEMTVETFVDRGSEPFRVFMLSQVRDEDIAAMYKIAKAPLPMTPEDVSLLYLTPAFILNELRVAFTIGFIVLLPFLLIDLVVSSILLSLGMMMVPPATISLPIKILMFVVIDGWSLVIQGVLGGFG